MEKNKSSAEEKKTNADAGQGPDSAKSKPMSKLEQLRATAVKTSEPAGKSGGVLAATETARPCLTRIRFLLASGGAAAGVTAATIITLRLLPSDPS